MTTTDIIRDMQVEYFDILLRTYRQMSSDIDNLAPNRVHSFVLDALSSSKLVMVHGGSAVPTALCHIETLLEEIREFWHKYTEQMTTCLRSIEGIALIAYFEPVHIATEIAPLLAFHDRLVIPDPFLMALTPMGVVDDLPKVASSLLADLYLLLCWRHLFCSQGGQVLLVLYPSLGLLEKKAMEHNAEYVLQKRRQFLSELLSKEINEEHDVKRVASDFSVSELIRGNQLGDALSMGLGHKGIMTKIDMERNLLGTRLSPAEAQNDTLFLLNDLHTRLHLLSMNMANSTKLLQDFNIEPWNWSLSRWLLSSESERIASLVEPSLLEEHFFQLVVRVEPLQWLAQLPLPDLLKLRANCSVESLRQEILSIRQQIRRARSTEVQNLLDGMDAAIQNAFEQHSVALADLQRQRSIKIAVATGKLGFAAAMTIAGTRFPPLLIPGAVASLVVGGNIIDIVKSYRQSKRDIAQEQGRPLGQLLRLRDESQSGSYYEVAGRNIYSYALATRLGMPPCFKSHTDGA